MKKLLVSFFALAVVCAMAMSAQAQPVDGNKICLKGSGDDFSTEGWENVFYFGDLDGAQDPSAWHIEYTSKKNTDLISYMQLTFTNGEVFTWENKDGFSTNGGGNNPGWVIVAPYGYEIDYIDQGNNNESESFVITYEAGNIQFNVSNFHQGSPDGDDDPHFVDITFNKNVIDGEKYIGNLFGDFTFYFDVYQAVEDGEDIYVGTYSTDTTGAVSFTIYDTTLGGGVDSVIGDYYIVENADNLAAGWKSVTEGLWFTVGNDYHPAFDGVASDDVASYDNEAIEYGSFWMAVHIPTSGVINGSTSLSLNPGGGGFIPVNGKGNGHQFSYFEVKDISFTNPTTCFIVGNNGAIDGATATVSLDKDFNIVITIDGITVSDAIHVDFSKNESRYQSPLPPGQYSFQVPVSADASPYTFTIYKSLTFDVEKGIFPADDAANKKK